MPCTCPARTECVDEQGPGEEAGAQRAPRGKGGRTRPREGLWCHPAPPNELTRHLAAENSCQFLESRGLCGPGIRAPLARVPEAGAVVSSEGSTGRPGWGFCFQVHTRACGQASVPCRVRRLAQVGSHSPFIPDPGKDVQPFVPPSVVPRPICRPSPWGAAHVKGRVPGGRVLRGYLGGCPHPPERWSPKRGLSGLCFLSGSRAPRGP